MGSPANIFLNNVALGDRAGTVQMHTFDGLTSGHASLAAKANVNSSELDCKMITLDSYLAANRIEAVNFVKVDIEGAELMFLKGALRLFSQDVPPIFLMEMAVGQTGNFGYHPNELVEFIAQRGDYEFFAVDEYKGKLESITGFADGHIGANVFCIPRNAAAERRTAIESFIH